MELLNVMSMEKVLGDTITQMLDAQVQAQPQIAPFRQVMENFFKKHMSWAALKDEFADAYAQEFTEAELKEITAFFKTPIGQKMASKQAALTARGMKIGQARVQENMPELQAALQAEAQKLQNQQ
jgi:hypothetical protein